MDVEVDDFGWLEAIESCDAGDLWEGPLMFSEVAEELRDGEEHRGVVFFCSFVLVNAEDALEELAETWAEEE